jgi:beta-mannosidase
MAIVSLRTARPYNMGSLYWQLNDVWPVVSWATVDYYGEWKAAHYKIRHVYKNLVLMVSPNATSEGDYEIFLVNDNQEKIVG